MVSKFRYIVLFLFAVAVEDGYCQSVPQGFSYQTTVRDMTGNLVTNQNVNFLFSFYSGSSSGTLQWQETRLLLSDSEGLIKTILGQGISTGAGATSTFNQINWAGNSIYLNVSIDVAGGSSFIDVGTAQLFSVPYAFYSMTAGNVTNLSLSYYADTDMSGISSGKLWKWNGLFWIPALDFDSDTVLFALNVNHAVMSDTSAYFFVNSGADSVLFSYQSDTAQYADISFSAINSGLSGTSDTALYAISSAPYAWKRNGNVSGIPLSKYVGSNDIKDVVFKTNSNEVLSVKSAGNIAIGNPAVITSFSSKGNDGMLNVASFGLGSSSSLGMGTFLMWYPTKSAFRAGGVSSNQWDDVNVGPYSFASGYDVIADNYGFATGNGSVADEYYGVAMGRKSFAAGAGVYPAGAAVALGDSSSALALRSVSIGKGNLSSMTTAVSIGVNNKATSSVALAMGVSSQASGGYSAVIGYYGSSNSKAGSFVYADASSTAVTNSTVNNQFLARASGGTIFYTNSSMTMGVYLASGGGSWSTVSDVTKKENFQKVDMEQVLNKISELKISSWNYKSQDRKIRHIGPMAQDFYRLFEVGADKTSISTTDMDGVIITGIKALNFKIVNITAFDDLKSLEKRIEQLDNTAALNERLDAIEKKIESKNKD
jgi:hypothetical protein